MAEFVLSAVLSLRDEFTARARNAQKSIQGVKGAVDNAIPSINGVSSVLDRAGRTAETTAFKTERLKRSLSGVRGNYYATIKGRDELSPLLDKAQTRLNRLRNSNTYVNLKAGLTEKLRGGIGGMASGMMMGAGMQMLGGAGIGFGLYNGIKSAMDFDAAMSGVKAITNASQEDFEKLRNKALEMGATTKFTATESAQALNFMGMAGWNAEQSIQGLPGIMHLAAASGEDLAMVSDIVTDSMSAFGLEAEKSGEFADVLAAAATKSNTNVGKMGYTFKYAAPLAGALGYSIQDVALAVGTMADSGIKGEQAGTSLRSLFTRLAKQPKEAATAMQALGLSMTDANGKMKPLRTMLLDMREKFKGLTEEQQTQYAAMLAGTEGMSGLLAIVNGNEEKFKALANAIDNSSGAAKRMADTRLDNLSGDLTYLSSAWDGFVLKLMNGNATSGLRGFVQEVNSLLNRFSKSVDEHGLGPRSVLGLIGDVVIDLKNKFLQLDGVGSVLAGGALAGGLYKIYKGVKSIADIAGGSKMSLPGMGNAGASMSNMTVQAGTVIVNGKNVTGGVGNMASGGSVPGGTAGAGGAAGGMAGAASKWGAFKTLNKIALPLAIGVTAYEAYNAEPGKQAETVARGAAGIGGAEVGAAIGTAIAGPVGTVVGGVLGSMAGTAIMDRATSGSMGNAPELEELKATLKENGTLSDFLATETDENRRIGVNLADYDYTEDNQVAAINAQADEQALEIEKGTAAAWESLWRDTAAEISGLKESMVTNATAEVSIDTAMNTGTADDMLASETEKAAAWESLWKEKADSVLASYQEMAGQIQPISETVNVDTAVEEPAFAGTETLEAERGAAESLASLWGKTIQSRIDSYRDMTEQITAMNAEIESSSVSGLDISVSAIDTDAGKAALQAESETASAWSGLWSGVAQARLSEYQDMTVQVTGLDSEIVTGATNAGSAIAEAFRRSSDETKSVWSGVAEWFSGVFASISSAVKSIGSPAAVTPEIPAHATGTMNFEGGLAQINEHGGELVELPSGSRIYPAQTTERIIQKELQAAPSSPPTVNIYGNTFVVREEADINKIAYEIAQMIGMAELNYGGA